LKVFLIFVQYRALSGLIRFEWSEGNAQKLQNGWSLAGRSTSKTGMFFSSSPANSIATELHAGDMLLPLPECFGIKHFYANCIPALLLNQKSR
jgi:hypothetical protein